MRRLRGKLLTAEFAKNGRRGAEKIYCISSVWGLQRFG
jgi:hypothetical protein